MFFADFTDLETKYKNENNIELCTNKITNRKIYTADIAKKFLYRMFNI